MRCIVAILFIFFNHISSYAIDVAKYRFHRMPETSYYGGIHSIAKDSIGRIWFSGYDALFVYDGNTYTQFNEIVAQHQPRVYWTFGQVVTDRSKRLYVASSQGLLRLNYTNKKFDFILRGNIGSLAACDDGAMYFVRNSRVESLTADGKLIIYPATPEMAITTIVSIHNLIYVVSKGKLYLLDTNTKKYKLFINLANDKFLIKDVVQSAGRLYILTWMNGLFEYSDDGALLHHFDLMDAKGNATSAKSLYIDKANTIWIATQSGLFLLDPVSTEMQILHANLHYPYSLPNNSVWSIFADPDGGIWIGTYGGKLAYMTFFDNDFNYFKPTLGGLNHPIVSCFAEDKKGNLWIGTEGGGVNYWNRKNDHFTYYTQDNNSGINSNMIKSMHYNNSESDLIISTFNGGVEKWINSSNRFVDLLSDQYSISKQLSVYDFALESKEGIWLTNPDSRLIFANKKQKKAEVISILDDNGNNIAIHIETLFRDKNDNLWLMTRNGIYVINVISRKIIAHYYISNAAHSINNICSYYITENDGCWFGTRGGGVNRLTRDGQYYNINDHDGLHGKIVFGILRDSATQQVWFSTNEGLYYYEEKSKKIRKFSLDVSSYCGTFYVRSCYKTINGEMLFGGTNGFIVFTPNKIKKNNQKPKVFFTDLLINNEKITPESKNAIIKSDISTWINQNKEISKIQLSHSQNDLEIRVSCNSYLHADKNQFAYRMTGFSDKWMLLPQGQKSIQFFNLPAGQYLFQIKAANNDGVWSNDISSILFEIRPSPFLSFWAYLVYSFLAFCILYFIWKYFTNKKIFRHQLQLEQQKEQDRQRLSQARINFFTNISHDLKTPLTLVIDPLKQLKEFIPKNDPQTASNYVQLIEKNVNRIQKMIGQLLQFREIESQKIITNEQDGDLTQYIKDIFSLFDLYANKKGIETEFTSELVHFYTKFDYDIVEKIFTNLFSNAIKFTTEKGFVSIKIETTSIEYLSTIDLPSLPHKSYISIAVSNTGTTIPEEKREAIFESFNRLSSSKLDFENSTGLGLTIVKELVSHLGGKIILQSDNAIVTFIVVLPFALSSTTINPDSASYHYTISEINNINNESQNIILQEKTGRKKYNVVVIEDDPDLRLYINQRLSEYYNVYTCINGNDGIDQTEKIYPQVVITDLMMPEADGFDVCKKIRSDIKTSHIPIIVISALGQNAENKIKALESGANVFIDKPFEIDYLLKQVENLIKNQEELKETYSKKYVAEPNKVTISSTDEDILQRAMIHIEKNMDNDAYNVDAFVSDMGIGRTLLYQKINDILGMSIKEFILDIRLKRGAQLLKQSELTIAEISYATGFNNPKYFSICFKKQYGLTPTEFRKKG